MSPFIKGLLVGVLVAGVVGFLYCSMKKETTTEETEEVTEE